MQGNWTEGESCPCEATCVCLKSEDEKVKVIQNPDLHTSQEEADTRIMQHMQHVSENDDKAIIVQSPDSNVMVLLLTLAQSINRLILFGTGLANNRRLLKVN
jgi:hypothetical protein